MYLIAFPLLLIPFMLYNMMIFLLNMPFSDVLFTISVTRRTPPAGDHRRSPVVIAMLLLYLEVLKAARFGSKGVMDHVLSFALFVGMAVELVLVPQATTPTLLLLTVLAFVDVIIGVSVSARPRRRDRARRTSWSRRQPSDLHSHSASDAMSRDFHLPGRSPVIACDGMAATSHPLATLAAVETLRAGGNAADAAVAAVAVLCVVEPQMTGIGGDCFCMCREPGKPVWGYNGSGRAGARASTEALLAQGIARRSRRNSIHAVTVPGAIDAWEAILKAHGRFGLDRALRRRSAMPRMAFRSPPRVAWDWARQVGKLAPMPARRATTCSTAARRRKATSSGCRRLPQTLKTIAARGARAFYEGPIAERDRRDRRPRAARFSPRRISRAIAARRSTPITEQLSRPRRPRIAAQRPGADRAGAAQHPRAFDLGALDPIGPGALPPRARGGAARLCACATRISPTRPTCATPVPALLDKGFAAKLAGLIDPDQPRAAAAGADARQRHGLSHGGRPRPHGGVADQLALLRSSASASAPRRPASCCTNRGACFVVEPDHPNTFGPRQAADAHHHPGARHARRPLRHGVRRDGRALPADGPRADRHQHGRLRHGRAGGDRRARAVLRGRDTVVERGVPAATVEGLKARGHDVALASRPGAAGRRSVIDWQRGVLIGGSDPRKDGCALGY